MSLRCLGATGDSVGHIQANGAFDGIVPTSGLTFSLVTMFRIDDHGAGTYRGLSMNSSTTSTASGTSNCGLVISDTGTANQPSAAIGVSDTLYITNVGSTVGDAYNDLWELVIGVFTWNGSAYVQTDAYYWREGDGETITSNQRSDYSGVLMSNLDNVFIGTRTSGSGVNADCYFAEASLWHTALDAADALELTTKTASSLSKYAAHCKHYWSCKDDLTDAKGGPTLVATNGSPSISSGVHPSVTYTGGAVVAVSSVSDDTLNNGQTSVTITGSGFKSSQGTGKVIISPTDDVTDANAVRQYVTTWSSDTSITFTAIRGTLQTGTQYLFVVNDDGDSNATGYPVSFNGLTPIILRWNM